MANDYQDQYEKVTLEFSSDFMKELRDLVVNTRTQSGATVTVEEFLEVQVEQMVEGYLEMIRKKRAEKDGK
jgi:argonaute-like protein implicated in RNA metabolism and viral defense